MNENETSETGVLTEEQLIQEFLKAIQEPIWEPGRKEPYTWTVPEVMQEFGLSRQRARTTLRKLAADGILFPTKVWRVDDWGEKRKHSGYKACGIE